MDPIDEDQVILEAASAIFDTSSESSSDDLFDQLLENNEDGELDDLLLQFRGQIVKKPRVESFLENVVGRLDDETFKSHFRVTRTTCQHLLTVLGEKITRVNPVYSGHPFTDPKKQLLFALWILGTPDSYRSVCNLFDVGKATGIRTVRRVVSALVDISPQVIKWPKRDEQENLSARFEIKAGFPGVVGCIDGCHIAIQAPKEHPESYYNRKSFHSIILQGVCDVDMMFTDCYIGEAGSVHDARVLGKSDVDDFVRGRSAEMFATPNHHLLGDAAYPVFTHLIPPYKDNGHVTQLQRNFNFKLSSTRTVIERAFGHLRGRWRRLKKLYMARIDLVPRFVLACCVLHNICIMQKDPNFDFDFVYEAEDDEAPINAVGMQPVPNDRAGFEKRVRLTNQLPLAAVHAD